MILILRLLSIIISLFVLVRTCICINKFHTLIPIIIVFDFAMVLPIILELFLGNPQTSYRAFEVAMNDRMTTILFNVFVISAQAAFFWNINKLSFKDNLEKEEINILKNPINILPKNINLDEYRNVLVCFSYLLPLVTVIAVLLSPDPSYYFGVFGSIFKSIDPSIQTYNTLIMNNLMYGLILAVCVLKWNEDNEMIGNIFISFYLILILIVNHKRTFIMITIGLCLIIDIIKRKRVKKIIAWYSIYIFLVAVYFVYYSYATGKILLNNDWYYVINEYFFRAMHMKFAIYVALNPSQFHILDYPGQSILFDLFYFIPRSIWHSKPLPYISYFTSGVLGYSSYFDAPLRMPPSYYPEFVSNFGIVGIWLSILFTLLIAKFFDNCNTLCKLLGTSLICLLEIYYYDNILKILVIMIIILCLFEKKPKFIKKERIL